MTAGLSLRQVHERHGASFGSAGSRAIHFGEPAAELRAAQERSVLVDRSDLGRILGSGPDLLDLLHRLSTASVRGLSPAEGRPTVLTSSKGRIVERLFVHHLGGAGVLLGCGSGSTDRVLAHMRRYTLRERTGLDDATQGSCQFALVGPAAASALEAAGWPAPPPWGVAAGVFAGETLHVLGQDGFSSEGYSIVATAAVAADLWSHVAERTSRVGCRPAGDLALEAYRISRGFPTAGHELTEAHNPLEAGLWDAVDFEKGCYVGQEVVARLRTYDKVSRVLVGLALPAGEAPPSPGAPLSIEGREVGRLTSSVLPPGASAPIALAYVKRRELDDGLEELTLEVPGKALRARITRRPSR